MSAKSIQRCMLAVAVLLQGCASLRSGLEPAPAGGAPTVACAAGTAVPERLLEPGSILLFGEIHGVQELPSFFGEAVCSTADARLPVEVGLEVPKTEQASIDTFLAS